MLCRARLALLFALGIIGKHEARAVAAHTRAGTIGEWLKTWTDYDKISTRGMSRWHDWIDWIGGYPYERASVDQIVDWFAKDGFRLNKLEDRSMGYGCNEFVFRREAGMGTYIDTPIPGGRWMARQFGRRVTAPFEQAAGGWTGAAQLPPTLAATAQLHVLRDNEILGLAALGRIRPGGSSIRCDRRPRGGGDPALRRRGRTPGVARSLSVSPRAHVANAIAGPRSSGRFLGAGQRHAIMRLPV